jgi:hypothetical protein
MASHSITQKNKAESDKKKLDNGLQMLSGMTNKLHDHFKVNKINPNQQTYLTDKNSSL